MNEVNHLVNLEDKTNCLVLFFYYYFEIEKNEKEIA